jgi:hypothetical protein
MGLFHTRSRTNLHASSTHLPSTSSHQLSPDASPALSSSVATPPSAHSSHRKSGKHGLLRTLSGIFKGAGSKKAALGIGHAAAPSAWRGPARSFDTASSPEPSLDIRPPSGLGAFGSVPSSPAPGSAFGSSAPHSPAAPAFATPELAAALRGRRRSQTIAVAAMAGWPVPPGHERFATESEIAHERVDRAQLSPSPTRDMGTVPEGAFRLHDLPLALLARALDELPRADVAALLVVDRRMCEAGLASLYGALDLRALAHADPARLAAVVALLGTRRDLAARVRSLVLPEPGAPETEAAIADALHNCGALQALRTPSATHVGASSFHLARLALTCTTLPARELWTLLAARPLLTHLALPALALPPDGELGALPPGLLPALRDVAGPPALLQALAPGRPVGAARVHLDDACSLHGGLKPAALAGALAQSTARVRSVALCAAHGADARTLERVLGALGLELGTGVKELAVACDVPEEVGRPARV